jgi:hypothetical protein
VARASRRGRSRAERRMYPCRTSKAARARALVCSRLQAIARAEAKRGKRARAVSAPTLCLCKNRARSGLAALILLVRSGRPTPRLADARLRHEGRSEALDRDRRSSRVASRLARRRSADPRGGGGVMAVSAWVEILGDALCCGRVEVGQHRDESRRAVAGRCGVYRTGVMA